MTQTTVTWLYGLLPPLDWDEECEREASTGQRLLWNALVAIEQERRAGEDCLYRADGRLGEIMERLDAVGRRLAQMTRRGTPEAERAERRTLWAEQSVLWGEANPLRNVVRRARAAEFRVLLERRYEAIKAARKASGLWWGNYNAVCANFDVALGRLGAGEMVRPKPETGPGDGRLTNPIQKGISAHTFLTRGHSQVRIDPMPEGHPLLEKGQGRRDRLRLLTVTTWSRGTRDSRRMVSFPIVWHRDLPEGAVIKQVVVQRRRVAADTVPSRKQAHYRWQAILTCSVPAPTQHQSDLVAGIDLGRRLVDGGLRLATIAGADGCVDHVL